jgi:hypothetical protein
MPQLVLKHTHCLINAYEKVGHTGSYDSGMNPGSFYFLFIFSCTITAAKMLIKIMPQ